MLSMRRVFGWADCKTLLGQSEPTRLFLVAGLLTVWQVTRRTMWEPAESSFSGLSGGRQQAGFIHTANLNTETTYSVVYATVHAVIRAWRTGEGNRAELYPRRGDLVRAQIIDTTSASCSSQKSPVRPLWRTRTSRVSAVNI
ncbi:hypothetical protein DPX16_20815 [Anabarilius grahami]|uniref:Uncharacterized protein n=1 Tax=Anabarilius grahami TaxID=495550 RepID=A0A3N0ZAH8_ANAGA|nr:hypothetical protein DPX16_20815 [Anabarilius grahami]